MTSFFPNNPRIRPPAVQAEGGRGAWFAREVRRAGRAAASLVVAGVFLVVAGFVFIAERAAPKSRRRR